jgi:hypothetical protein
MESFRFVFQQGYGIIYYFRILKKESIKRLCLCGSGKQRLFLGVGKILPNMIIIIIIIIIIINNNNRGIFCHIPYLKKKNSPKLEKPIEFFSPHLDFDFSLLAFF